MSLPFVDPGLIVSAISGGLAPGLVAAVAEIGDPDQARERRARTASPAVLVLPQRTEVDGPTGLGNGRMITEAFGCVIQIRQAAPDGGLTARATIREIRSALFDLLEGTRIDINWSPALYQGGHLLELDDDPGQIYRWIDYYTIEIPSTIK